MTTNREVIVTTLPTGTLTPDHFEMREGTMPAAGEGEAVVRTILMSIDAANRAWMQGATYREPVLAGDAMHTYSIGEVVSSKHPRLTHGMTVGAQARSADFAVSKATPRPDRWRSSALGASPLHPRGGG